MKASHELLVDISTKELAKMLAKATPSEFTGFWMEWERQVDSKKLDEIGKSWSGFSNGKRVFNELLTMIKYHEITGNN